MSEFKVVRKQSDGLSSRNSIGDSHGHFSEETTSTTTSASLIETKNPRMHEPEDFSRGASVQPHNIPILEEKRRLADRLRGSREAREADANPKHVNREGRRAGLINEKQALANHRAHRKKDQDDHRQNQRGTMSGGQQHQPQDPAARTNPSRGSREARKKRKDRDSRQQQNTSSGGLIATKLNQNDFKARRSRQQQENLPGDGEEVGEQDEYRSSDVAPGAVWERPTDAVMPEDGSNLLARNLSVVSGDSSKHESQVSTMTSAVDSTSVTVARAEVVDDQVLENRIREKVKQEVVQADVLTEQDKPLWQRKKFICIFAPLLVVTIVLVVVVAAILANRSSKVTVFANPTATPSVSTAPSDLPSVSPSHIPTSSPTKSPVPSSAPSSSPTVTPPCLTSLTTLFQEEQEADVSIRRKYVLCSMRSYPIDIFINGNVRDTKDEFGNSAYQHPLILRPNVTIQCGEDGSRENNCVLFGGDYGVFAAGLFFGSEILDDVVVQGMRFVNSNRYNVLLRQPGKVSFVDCSFTVRAMLGYANNVSLSNPRVVRPCRTPSPLHQYWLIGKPILR